MQVRTHIEVLWSTLTLHIKPVLQAHLGTKSKTKQKKLHFKITTSHERPICPEVCLEFWCTGNNMNSERHSERKINARLDI